MSEFNAFSTRIGGAIAISFGLAASGVQARDFEGPKPLIAEGLASWYGEEMAIGEKNGRLIYNDTPSGIPFNPNVISAAHRTLPLGSCVLVKTENKSLKITVTDRGPAEWTGKIIDISRKGAEVLGFKDNGKTHVKLFPC
jgi:rare lipoprotein A